ncbi:hypothetical protein NQ315_011561 [Exocentrus adspersus]|uniref:Peptidase S1 domain-containing protein n=1 Tax=Exocentrus adspersus TaxID=1586481 RepID=A0AAV8VVQ7_9CUCU|nr:hypothetical protein NQ315_011561 [Exocentrus adspersus]
MKLPICLLTFSGCLALLSAHLSQDRSIGENVYFEPRSNYMLDGRIIGGEEAVPHSRPYHVGILIDGRTLCSGSLISPNYVLTAAHCTINASYVDLIFGAHNVNIQEPTQLRVTSSVIINHPDYGNTTTYSNDIALIKTPTPIVTNNNIKLVRLPPANAASYEHSFGALSGWGTTSDSSSSISPLLRVVHLVILDYFTCLVDIRPNVYERTNLCTSGRGNVGACHGDFGSPLDQTKAGSLYFEPRSNYTLDGGRIIGGKEVAPHSRPYHVAILINGRSLCSGSLISPNYVLTAAHCTINATYVDLIFGAHNINVQEPSEIHVTSTVIINHPDYGNPSTYSNDIAVIKTPRPIVTNDYIKLVRLPPANAGSYLGTVAALSGWGTTSDSNSSLSTVLREVYLVIWDLYTCYINIIPDVYDEESNLCTSGKGKVGACNGDSGSPLVVRNTQVGIVSYVSTNVCESGHPTVYTRVSFYRKWINENSDL